MNRISPRLPGILFPLLTIAAIAASALLPLPADAATAGGLLGTLDVAAESNAPAYQRSRFPHWTSRNGCTTRQAVLLRQNGVRPRPACTTRTGRWHSAYDGQTFTLARSLDIDHFVPLKEAWISGARTWDSRTRTAFANDVTYRRSLIAVSASSNRSKSDHDPAEWLPPRHAYRCTYLVSWIAVKYRWNLSIDSLEYRVLRRALRRCPAGAKRLRTPPRAAITRATSGDDPRFTTSVTATASRASDERIVASPATDVLQPLPARGTS